MMLVLLKLDVNKKVIAQWNTDHPAERGLFDATGRSDGPNYMGRTYIVASDSFTPLPTRPPTRLQELKAINPVSATLPLIFELLQLK